jgi:membrane protease YdiL (CAAX protease family)
MTERTAPTTFGLAVKAPGGLVPFLVGVFGLTGLLLLPAGLAQRGLIAGPVDRFIPLVILGFWSPTLAALLVAGFALPPPLTARGEGPGVRFLGVRALLRPLGIWRVNPGWYLVALGLPAAIYGAGLVAYQVVAGAPAGPWLSPPLDGQRIAAMLMLPLVDQIGWRGFAYPRLARRHGALVASLILGVLWGAWHTGKQMLFDEGAASVPPPLMMLYFVAGTVVFTWVYNRTGGSLLLVVVTQMGAYLTKPSPDALPGRVSPLAIVTVAFVVAAVALVAVDRRAWPARDGAALRAI